MVSPRIIQFGVSAVFFSGGLRSDDGGGFDHLEISGQHETDRHRHLRSSPREDTRESWLWHSLSDPRVMHKQCVPPRPSVWATSNNNAHTYTDDAVERDIRTDRLIFFIYIRDSRNTNNYRSGQPTCVPSFYTCSFISPQNVIAKKNS